MGDKNKEQLPHLIISNTATTEGYTRPSRNISSNKPLFPDRNRQSHAKELIRQINNLLPAEKSITQQQKTYGLSADGRGIYVEFKSDPDFRLKLESLENKLKGIELCTGYHLEDDTTSAIVFIPEGELDYFLEKVTTYQHKDTPKNKPKNQPLIDSISEIKLAVLESLWTDDSNLLPKSNGSSIWWEVWIRLSTDTNHNIDFFREHAEKIGLKLRNEVITFVDRAVILAYGTREDMIKSISLLGVIA